jgi:hypothetical protein
MSVRAYRAFAEVGWTTRPVPKLPAPRLTLFKVAAAGDGVGTTGTEPPELAGEALPLPLLLQPASRIMARSPSERHIRACSAGDCVRVLIFILPTMNILR